MSVNQGPQLIIDAVPSAPRPAQAQLLAQPDAARGFLKAQEDEAKDGKAYNLYGRVQGKNWNSRLLEAKNRHVERLDKQIEELWKAGNALKEYWDGDKDIEISVGRLQMSFEGGRKITQADFYDKIRGKIKERHPNAENIAFDFSDFTVRCTENGELHEIKKEEIPKEILDTLNFLNLWQETHETAMLILGIRSWHTRLGTDGNRPVHGEKPFTLANKTTLDLFMPKDHTEFMAKHLQPMLSQSKTYPELGPGAEARIRRVHAFIERFKTAIQNEIETKKSQPEAPKNEIAELEKLKEKLDSINGASLYCLYWASAFLGDPIPTNADEKSKKAQMLQNALLETFKSSRLLNPEKLRNPFAKGVHLPYSGKDGLIDVVRASKPTEDDFKSLAIQAGDLYFHSDLDYLARFESSGAKRMVRPSIVEFVMNQMMHPEADYIDDLRSLELNTADHQLQQTVRGLIQQARS